MTIGHEYVGVVVEKGRGVKNVKIGDRVTGEGHIAWWALPQLPPRKIAVCENTIGVGVNRDGAFAEYLRFRLPMLFTWTTAFLTKQPPS